ncbi:ABC transporter related protein [Methanosalsum zhilinae DSM 4017]|uniref:ABC transporter related protein n=1 Tax=Methanosalsum zhilinae (strain DSM 4017 / NBRC 107636 / OCM 62 / WeN5) TaxID=679901 RepID=F7XN48_METZD|nr:hypothetical protein [Methanosalsum zhilinae]AEH61166.1 ABC transporter related protein [Methanosalsum zhilinae DSM 4017]
MQPEKIMSACPECMNNIWVEKRLFKNEAILKEHVTCPKCRKTLGHVLPPTRELERIRKRYHKK